MAEHIFTNIKTLGNGKYLTYLNGDELVTLWQAGVILYNPEIQRGSRISSRNTEEIEEAIYSRTNVRKIYEAMLSDNYFEDMITINILDDDNYVLDDETEGQIYVMGQINIADGQHRIRALELIKKTNDTGRTNVNLSNFVYPVMITNYNLNKAKMQFYQFSKGLKISATRAEYFNTVDHANQIVRYLIGNSELNGRVELIRNTITKSEKRNVVTFATLVNAINLIYRNMTTEQENELSEYLSQFFNSLFNITQEFTDYVSRQESKANSLKAENFAFYGYIAISKLLKNKDNWQEYMPRIQDLDFSKASNLWFGNVTKRANEGYAIVNSNDSRNYFVRKIEEQFGQLISE